MRRAFGTALDEAIRRSGIGVPQVAEAVGLTADAVHKWRRGEAEPPPLTVFAVEELLGCSPGDLSRQLGYTPVSVASVPAAIDAAEDLTEEAKRMLVNAYRAGRSRGPRR